MPHPVYLTKEDAAAHSGLSIRRIQELAKTGEIRRHYTRDAETNRNVVLYLAEDVQNLRDRRMSGVQVASLALRAPQSQAIAPAPTTEWMTLYDAARLSGLPEAFLQYLIDNGKLPAFNVGVRPGGRFRVSRRDLEALEAPKHYGGPKKRQTAKK